MPGVVLVYCGFIAMLVAVVAIIRPIKSVRLAPRRRGMLLLVAGAGLVAVGMMLPAGEVRTLARESQLDAFVPNYQFREVHSIRIRATPQQIHRAIHEVTAREITFFRLLTWTRRFGRPGPESILNAPERMPIIDVATRSGFLMLADDVSQEVLLGTVVLAPPAAHRPATPADFEQLMTAPGYALAAMNFRISPNEPGTTLLTTETRVYATDAGARRTFARYWRVIYPGSALIRRSWLRAVRRRVEKA